MFLRFIGTEIDLRTGRHKGIFTLAYELRDANVLLAYELDHLNELLVWFGRNLPKPDRFTKKKNISHRDPISIAWFKDSSQELITKIWEIVHILEVHDIIVEVIRSEKPGYIIYEDEYQVVVDPF